MRKSKLSEEERKKRNRERQQRWASRNKEKIKQKRIAYRLKNPDYRHNYYLNHLEKSRESTRKSNAKRKELYHKNIDGYRDKYLIQHKQELNRLRMEVLQHYGGITPKCACCGEANIPFLAIDHINGDGSKHRKITHLSSGVGLYYWLRKNGYPEGFQVLCFNCNHAKFNSKKKHCPIHHPEEYA